MDLMIGERIKKYRKDQEMTQDALAQALGVSPQSVSKWECVDGYPDITLLPTIANFFEVTVDELIGNDEISAKEDVQKNFFNVINSLSEEERLQLAWKYYKKYPRNWHVATSLMHRIARYQGEKAEEYEQKLDKAIKEVSGYALTYDSLPILAAYCASTAGKTQNAKDVWGGEYPYLAAVNSEWDRLDKNNSSTATFSANDLKQKLSTLAEISGEESKWFCDIVKNSSGYVSKLTLCGKEVTGSEIRKALDLKSSAFDITLKDGNFVFSVRGYGHGVGMSQVGAGKMAENGSAYEEILTHYYSGCIVEKIN